MLDGITGIITSHHYPVLRAREEASDYSNLLCMLKHHLGSLSLAESNAVCFTGSETAGDDALLGNVSKLTVTPPGHTGAARKGHLVFDACFESGNLGRVDYISEFEFDLFIRPDTCNPRFRVWFNFTVENVRETQCHSSLSLWSLLLQGDFHSQ
ncbi:Cytosolic carboxypeptidase 6 [Bagarius yarrelli]|uniref:Cytosolic carboxypeptidase 6 n=1 Tax=Bagarius yarrelli TaxID=175774 RepID=A0A556U7V4_BAGYA|nr:Cytosolic carboxypeptidase 6 [Bagarius yarrelli]